MAASTADNASNTRIATLLSSADQNGHNGNAEFQPGKFWDPGGFFRADPNWEALQSQADLIQRMISREGVLYPEIQSLLQNNDQAALDAYNAETGGISETYPELMAALDYQMSPESLAALNSITDERRAGISSGANTLAGDIIKSLAERGLTSVDTADGAGYQIDKNISPLQSRANQDYLTSLLTLPKEMAQTKYNIADNYGTTKANSLRNRSTSVLSPFMDVWKTTLGVGQMGVQNATDPRLANAGTVASTIGQMVGRNQNKPDIKYGYENYNSGNDLNASDNDPNYGGDVFGGNELDAFDNDPNYGGDTFGSSGDFGGDFGGYDFSVRGE